MNIIFTIIKPDDNRPHAGVIYKTAEIGFKDSIRKDLERFRSELDGIDIPITINLSDGEMVIDQSNIPHDKFEIIKKALEK